MKIRKYQLKKQNKKFEEAHKIICKENADLLVKVSDLTKRVEEIEEVARRLLYTEYDADNIPTYIRTKSKAIEELKQLIKP